MAYEYDSDDEGDHDNDSGRHAGRVEKKRSVLVDSKVLDPHVVDRFSSSVHFDSFEAVTTLLSPVFHNLHRNVDDLVLRCISRHRGNRSEDQVVILEIRSAFFFVRFF